MKYFFIICLYSIVLFSCNENEQRPTNILDEEKIASVLVDIELLEAVVKQKILDRKYPKKNVPVYYRQVMEKNGITYEQFQESYNWWKNRPKLMKGIYDDVNNRLIKMKEELPEIEKKKNQDTKTKSES